MSPAALPDSDAVVAIIRETAERDVMPRFRRLESHEITEKHKGEVLTVADLDAEHRLTRRLSDLLPGSVVVGEEAVSHDRSVLGRLDGGGAAWLVDPVDGTANFAAGHRVFAIIVSYLVDGITRAGWIHDPCTGSTAVAIAGEGAWLDGKRMKSAAAPPLEQMIGTLNISYFPHHRHNAIRKAAKRFQEIRNYRCAAHDYLALAGGSKHFSLYRRLWPWDHAAGVLMLAEAGGHTALLDGAPYHATERVRGMLSACDIDCWHAVKNHLEAA